jgi:hypothetical protein
MPIQKEDDEITSNLTGNTLRVYKALLNSDNGVLGVRELQRQLKFSSPALASYHLNKLEDLELVVKERGDYRLIKEVKVGILKQFVKIGKYNLPRYFLYATMFTTLLIFFLSQMKEVSFYSVFSLIFGFLATTILWYETISVWRQKI